MAAVKKGAASPAAYSARTSGFWEERVSPLLQRRALWLLIFFILIGAARIVSTYQQLSITTDEGYHLGSGLEYLTAHVRGEGQREQPPLAQAAVALLPLIEGARIDPRTGIRQLFEASPGKHLQPWGIIAAMRAGTLPFFVTAAVVVFWAARRLFGSDVAVLSAALFTLVPPVLAHGGLATTDMAATALVSAAFAALVYWSESPRLWRAAALGGITGMAILAKFSALVYLPAGAALALIFTLAFAQTGFRRFLRSAAAQVPSLCVAAAVGSGVIWAAYWFAIGTVPAWHNSIRVPAPELWDGIHAVAAHNAAGHPAYLLGQQRTMGWWYYFPVVLGVKTPLAFLLLVIAGLWPAWHMRRQHGLLPAAFSLGILLPAMTGHINIGVRHILPIYTWLSILGGLGAMQLGRWLARPLIFAAALLILIGWMAISGAVAHPDYLAYFNEFGGSRPDRIVVDSDLDWGQDFVLVGRRLRKLHAGAVWFDLNPYAFPNADLYESLYSLPPIQPNSANPKPGWHAIGLTPLRLAVDNSSGASVQLPWYERLEPAQRIGGMLLFRVSDK